APATPAVGPGGGAPAQVGTPLGEVPLLLGGRRTTASRATSVCGGGVAARRGSAGRRPTEGRPVGRRTAGPGRAGARPGPADGLARGEVVHRRVALGLAPLGLRTAG